MPWSLDCVLNSIRERLPQSQEGLSEAALKKHLAYDKRVLSELSRKCAPRGFVGPVHLQGMGGSGVVVRVDLAAGSADAGSPTAKCIKYPHPTLGDKNMRFRIDALHNEAGKLKELHHEHVMPISEVDIIDLGEPRDIEPLDRRVPYYVMPYVESLDLAQYVRTSGATPATLVRLLSEAAAGLRHIHSSGHAHLDVKPGNIYVQDCTGPSPSALLADFGSCKEISTGTESRTLLITTEPYAHPELLAMMKNRSVTSPDRTRGGVPRKLLDPRFDRFAFGLTIVDTIIGYLRGVPTEGRSRTLPIGLFRGLQIVALRCSDGQAQHYRRRREHKLVAPANFFEEQISETLKYENTDELAGNLRVLASDLTGYVMEDEVADVGRQGVRVPPESFVPLTSRVRQALDSAAIRRLTGISQLSLCSHVYPGASHNRKEHSLGVYGVATRCLRHMATDDQNPIAAMLLNRKHQRLCMLAALFHDSSHVPLLHELEDSVPALDQQRYLYELLDGRWGNDAFQKELGELLESWGLSRADMKAVLAFDHVSGENEQTLASNPAYELIRTLLDGAIDADKLDSFVKTPCIAEPDVV